MAKKRPGAGRRSWASHREDRPRGRSRALSAAGGAERLKGEAVGRCHTAALGSGRCPPRERRQCGCQEDAPLASGRPPKRYLVLAPLARGRRRQRGAPARLNVGA